MGGELKPSIGMLIKLGSLIVHYQEAYSPKGHEYDKVIIAQLEADPDVITWLASMTKAGFLPVKR